MKKLADTIMLTGLGMAGAMGGLLAAGNCTGACGSCYGCIGGGMAIVAAAAYSRIKRKERGEKCHGMVEGNH